MVRTIAIALFGLSLAFAAQAMPLSPFHQPDSMITQARMGCGMGRVMVNGSASPELACARSAEPCADAHDGTGASALSSTDRRR